MAEDGGIKISTADGGVLADSSDGSVTACNCCGCPCMGTSSAVAISGPGICGLPASLGNLIYMGGGMGGGGTEYCQYEAVGGGGWVFDLNYYADDGHWEGGFVLQGSWTCTFTWNTNVTGVSCNSTTGNIEGTVTIASSAGDVTITVT